MPAQLELNRVEDAFGQPNLRVLHVIPSVSPVHGGPSKAIAIMESALTNAGVSVTTLTTDDGGPGCRYPAAARPAPLVGARRVYVPKRSEFYKAAPGLLPWLCRNVSTFDVVHIHALFSFSSTAAGLIARSLGVPYIVRPLGTLSTYGLTKRRRWLKQISLSLVERRILEHAAAVHFTSTAEEEEARALSLRTRRVVIPLGVERVALGAESASCRAQLDQRDHPTILYLSRLDPKKNVEGLLRAYALLPRPRPTLLIAGDGTLGYTASLRSLAAALDIDREIRWLGRVSGETKATALAAADLFVLPSFSENFGIAAAEAMLAGIPVVLGRGVAIAKDVENAGGGLVVAPDPDSIRDGLKRLITDPTLRRTMGECARTYAETAYSTEAMARRLIELYSSLKRNPASIR